MEVEGVLQQELIDGGAGGVGWATFGDAGFAISLWVNIIAASGKQDALDTKKNTGYSILPLMQRDQDGCHPGGMKGGQVGRKGTLIVGGIGAGGLRYGDVDGHGSNQCMPMRCSREEHI